MIHTLDGNDIVMITPLQSGEDVGMIPRGNGELYRLTRGKNGKVVAHKIGETPSVNMTQMSGFQRKEHGKTVTSNRH